MICYGLTEAIKMLEDLVIEIYKVTNHQCADGRLFDGSCAGKVINLI